VAAGLYCYGVTSAEAAQPQTDAGLGGAQVDAVRFKELAALVSPVPPGTVRARRRDLLAHFDVLAAAFRDGTVLPLRFGIAFDDERQLVQEFLKPRHEELLNLLDALRGKAELRVTAHYREEAILAETIRENPKIARLREATQRVSGLHPAQVELGQLVSAEVQARTARDSRAVLERMRRVSVRDAVSDEAIEYQVLRASFLVERDRLGEFDAALEGLASEHAGRMDIKVVGPLPPHSFVDITHQGGR
jgi:gas vesicle protein GvpL/GvpF